MANEKRLIDYERAKAIALNILRGKITTVTAVKLVTSLKGATVDAVEVVHSRAVLAEATNIVCTHKCAMCDALIVFNDNYCPNCGAKMDGDGNG